MHKETEKQALEPSGVVVRKRRKGIYILPNLFTLAALFGGFYAIVMAMNGRFDYAAAGGVLRHGTGQSGWSGGAHDQHSERLRRADGLACPTWCLSAPHRH
jgi:hypothetical protein